MGDLRERVMRVGERLAGMTGGLEMIVSRALGSVPENMPKTIEQPQRPGLIGAVHDEIERLHWLLDRMEGQLKRLHQLVG